MGNQLSDQYHQSILPRSKLSVWLGRWSILHPFWMWWFSVNYIIMCWPPTNKEHTRVFSIILGIMKPQINFHMCKLWSVDNQVSDQYHKSILLTSKLSVWLERWSIIHPIQMWSSSVNYHIRFADRQLTKSTPEYFSIY